MSIAENLVSIKIDQWFDGWTLKSRGIRPLSFASCAVGDQTYMRVQSKYLNLHG